MKRAKKISIITAAVLISVGLLISAVSLVAMGFDFTRLSTVKYSETTHNIYEDFENIHIDSADGDVILAPSVDGSCRVVSNEINNVNRTVSIKNGTLKISSDDNRRWYEYITVDLTGDESKITLYLPKKDFKKISVSSATGDIYIPNNFTFESVKIENDTGEISVNCQIKKGIDIETYIGNIYLSDLSPETVEIESETGFAELNNISCKRLLAENNIGDIRLKNVKSEESIYASSDTGNIALNDCYTGELNLKSDVGDIALYTCDADVLDIKTDTGNIKGTLTSDKIFIADSDTGTVDVPESITGGKCVAKSAVGDIKFEIIKQ